MSSRRLAGLCAVVVLLATGCAKPPPPPGPTPSPTPAPTPVVPNPLNGMLAPPPDVAHRVAAVMIDNFPDARPQSGLRDADVVYEVEAEGGITRYLALFLRNATAQIGPVRSARTYFVDLARPYDPYFAHAGQNDDVIEFLQGLRAAGFADMDEIQHTPEAFWRDKTREMPHNLYTSVVRIRKVGPTYGYADKKYAGNQFDYMQAAPESNSGDAPSDGSGPIAAPSPAPAWPPEAVASFWLEYDVHFVWDGTAYQRFIDGQAQHDLDDDRPYEVSDIIVVWIRANVLDAIGDLSMDVYGTYPAVLVRAGHAIAGKWVATGPASVPRLEDNAGAPMPLQPGQIYVEIMPQGSTLKVGKQTWSH